MNKKVALFLPSLCGGGAERVMVELARNLSKRGVLVDMVLVKAEGPYLSELTSNIRVIDLGKSRVIGSLFGLVGYLRKEKPNTLLSTLTHANTLAVMAKLMARVPVRLVLRQAITLSISRKIETRSGLSAKLLPFFVHALYPLADSVIAVSKGVADDLVRETTLPVEKIAIISNPVVGLEFYRKAEQEISHPWLQPGEPPVVLGVGRLTIAKDFNTLIEAFVLVLKIRPMRLIILGEGEQRKELQAKIDAYGLGDVISLPGFVQNPLPFMSKAGVFVLSSISEGLPNVLIQSLAIGTPVVATDCPSGPDEILESGRWGYLVPMRDPVAMSESIVQAIDSARGRLNGEVRRYCEARFGDDSVSMSYMKELLPDQ